MKFIAVTLMATCAFFLIYDWVTGQYVGAMIQAVCLYINHYSYCEIVEGEKEQKKAAEQQAKKDELK